MLISGSLLSLWSEQETFRLPFQSHQGDSRWIKVTLRAGPPSALSCRSPRGSCDTQTLLNVVEEGFAFVLPMAPSQMCPICPILAQ